MTSKDSLNLSIQGTWTGYKGTPIWDIRPDSIFYYPETYNFVYKKSSFAKEKGDCIYIFLSVPVVSNCPKNYRFFVCFNILDILILILHFTPNFYRVYIKLCYKKIGQEID